MSTGAKKTEERNKVKDSNIYRISFKNGTGKSVFISKVIIKKFGSIQIESVGAATSEATKVAQILVKQGYATSKSIRTEQFHPDEIERREAKFQIKLIVVLEKTAQFDKLTEDLSEKRPEKP